MPWHITESNWYPDWWRNPILAVGFFPFLQQFWPGIKKRRAEQHGTQFPVKTFGIFAVPFVSPYLVGAYNLQNPDARAIFLPKGNYCVTRALKLGYNVLGGGGGGGGGGFKWNVAKKFCQNEHLLLNNINLFFARISQLKSWHLLKLCKKSVENSAH